MADAIQLIGHGEHDMKMLYIQGITHTIFGPNHLFGNLTLGTMPIATTVITEAFVGATVVIALVFMSAKCWRAALLQCIQRSNLVRVGLALRHKVSSKQPDNIGYFVAGSRCHSDLR